MKFTLQRVEGWTGFDFLPCLASFFSLVLSGKTKKEPRYGSEKVAEFSLPILTFSAPGQTRTLSTKSKCICGKEKGAEKRERE